MGSCCWSHKTALLSCWAVSYAVIHIHLEGRPASHYIYLLPFLPSTMSIGYQVCCSFNDHAVIYHRPFCPQCFVSYTSCHCWLPTHCCLSIHGANGNQGHSVWSVFNHKRMSHTSHSAAGKGDSSWVVISAITCGQPERKLNRPSTETHFGKSGSWVLVLNLRQRGLVFRKWVFSMIWKPGLLKVSHVETLK